MDLPQRWGFYCTDTLSPTLFRPYLERDHLVYPWPPDRPSRPGWWGLPLCALPSCLAAVYGGAAGAGPALVQQLCEPRMIIVKVAWDRAVSIPSLQAGRLWYRALM